MFADWKILRYPQASKDYVYGTIYYGSSPIAYTLEKKSTMIPDGIYKMELCNSPAFSKKRGKDVSLPLLYNDNVPAKRGIRIHAGNTIKDTKGCVLVGFDYDWEGTLSKSAEAETTICRLLETWCDGKDMLTIITL